MNEQQLIKICLQLDATQVDYPFGDSWAVLRHANSRKWFACVFIKADELCINLKINPHEGDMLRQAFVSIEPAYHMNKEHWIMLKPNSGDVDQALLKYLIENSYNLTKKAKPQKQISLIL